MKNTLFKGFIVASVIFASGCANTNKQMYTWGQYEDLVYEFHNTDSSIKPQKQIAMLQEAVAEAKKTNKKVGPGVLAHLGMLYSSVGEADKAKAALEEERTIYPEAETFINGMLKRSQEAK